MKLEERKIAVTELTEGMYVCRLDRDWEGTGFPLQGVMIEGQADIDALARLCETVYVDILLGRAPDEPPEPEPASRPRAYASSEIEALQRSQAYPELAAFETELPQAREAQAQVVQLATRLLDDVRAGRAIAADEVRGAVEPMVRSMVRNVDAFLWVDRLRERGAYEYDHALGCSALAAALGRHLGLPEPLLVDLAIGALLLDIGKLRVPAGVLDRPARLGMSEMREVREHVGHSLDLLQHGEAIPAHVREMIATHHERFDGSGYPAALTGERIPLLGRIAAVIDSYHAMISARPHRPPMSQQDALQELYRSRDRLYASEVVEQFLQCMSVYPVGSLVQLTTGEVALVMAQNAARRLLPRVMVLTTPEGELLEGFSTRDLMLDGDREDAVRIVGTRTPAECGLDPVELFL